MKNTSLANLDTAIRALEAASSLEEVKRIADIAEAARVYAKAAKLGLEAQNRAAEIHLLAQRKAGEMLATMEKNKGHLLRGSKMLPRDGTPKLKDLGINKFQSHRWQRIASVPLKAFENHVNEAKVTGREITTSGVLMMQRQISNQKKHRPLAEQSKKCAKTLQGIINSGVSYGTIYADPPWKYGNQGTRAATNNHYPTLTVGELCDLPISGIAAEQSHLHLWTTNGFLFEAKSVMDAWGFSYKSCFVWVKPQMGIGNYWRVSHEFLLLGVRGTRSFDDKSLKSWAEIRRSQHSRKPEAVRNMIEKASPGPRIEIFARRAVPGWTVWGNEIDYSLFDIDSQKKDRQNTNS